MLTELWDWSKKLGYGSYDIIQGPEFILENVCAALLSVAERVCTLSWALNAPVFVLELGTLTGVVRLTANRGSMRVVLVVVSS